MSLPIAKWYITIAFLLITLVTNAQEYNYWQMGRISLDFNTEPPTQTQEWLTGKRSLGWGSICDDKGNLKYYHSATYTDWDIPTQDSILNANGDYIGGLTNVFRTNNKIFFRYSDSIYYIFYEGVAIGDTIKRSDTTVEGTFNLYYSIINTQLNGGKGGVISPIKPLINSGFDVTLLSATQNADSSWWVACRSADSLYAIKISNAKVYPPVITYAKERTANYLDKKFSTYSTYLIPSKFSHDGTLLVTSVIYSPFYRNYNHPFPVFNTPDSLRQNIVSAYQFNKQTGEFSNQQVLKKFTHNDYGKNVKVMSFNSIAFSPNDSLIYLQQADTAKLPNSGPVSILFQYKRHTTNILSTEKEIYRNQNLATYYKFIHLGQNGRIYLSQDGRYNTPLGYIYYPDREGKDCKVILQGLLAPCYNPTFPNIQINCAPLLNIFTRYHGNKMAFAFVPQCDSSVQMQNGCDTTKFTKYQWFIYGTAGNNHVDSAWGKAPKFKLPASGRYWVKLRGTTPSGYRPWYSDTIDFKILPVPKAKLSINSNTGCRYVAFEFTDSTTDGGGVNPQTGQTWVFNFGEGKDSTINLPAGQTPTGKFLHTYTQTGNYNVNVHYTNGYCADSFVFANSIKIVDAPQPGIIISDNNVCQPATINFKRTYQDTITKITYNFDDGSADIATPVVLGIDNPQDYNFTKAGQYNVLQTLEGATGCITTDSIEVTILKGFEANQTINLNYVTVEDSNSAKIDWNYTDDAKLYEVYRSTNKQDWKKVTSIDGFQKNEYLNQPITTSNQQYFYKVIAFDTCLKTIESNIGSTIVLKGKNFDNEFAVIEWSPYENWVNGIDRYEIQVLEGIDNWVPIAQEQNTNYKDLNFTDGANLTKCYRIEAFENNSPFSSKSNKICLPVAPMLWIPNAFTPNNDLLNDTFKVTTLGIEKLKISIFNSIGEEIYNSTNVDFTWDGTYKNKPVPEGAYIYLIQAIGTDKKIKFFRGSISLLR
jgi:gliding motility-associated-like protein